MDNTAKHTPGPLMVDYMPLDIENACTCLRESSGTTREWVGIGPIVKEDGCTSVGEHTAYCHQANAPLYAAAPELLEALEGCFAYMDRLKDTRYGHNPQYVPFEDLEECPEGHEFECGFCGVFQKARAAIAKVKGPEA